MGKSEKELLSNATLENMKLALVKGGGNGDFYLSQDSTCAQESVCGKNLVSSCPNNLYPLQPGTPPVIIKPDNPIYHPIVNGGK